MTQRSTSVNEDTTDLGELRPGKKLDRADAEKMPGAASKAAGKNVSQPTDRKDSVGNAAKPKSTNGAAGSNGKHRTSGDLLIIAKEKSRNSPDRSADIAASRTLASSGLGINDVVADRYLIVENLPCSGMGQIHKALDRQRATANLSSTYVALKFARRADENRHGLSRIENEFRKLSNLQHRNIVRAIELGAHHGAEYVVLEWLDGKSLLTVLDEQTSKRMALVRAREIVISVAAGLAHAHEKNIVHGDVKPLNIFITSKSGVKLLDFGTSTEHGDDPESRNWATEAYASAEVLSGKPATKVDDVYSLGVTAYMLLSGGRPFGSKDAVTARKAGLVPKPLPADADEHWPVIEAALSFDPGERPCDAEQFLAGFDGGEWQKAPDPAPRISTIGHVGGILPYAAALLFLLLVWGGWSMRSAEPPAPDINDILQRADMALLQGSLIEPSQRSAFHYYRRVLKLAPDNARARDGMNEVTNGLLARAGQSLTADDFRAARRNFSLAAQVNPSHPGIPLVSELINRHARDLIVRADRIALSNPQGADQLLLEAEQLTGTNNADIAAVRGKMADAMVEMELQRLFDGIDTRILAERLAVPKGDSAIDLLGRARGLRPNDRRIPVAANRIVSALLFQALFAISEGNLGVAEDYIAAAKTLDTRHLAMSRAEYELVKARNRLGAEQPVDAAEEDGVE